MVNYKCFRCGYDCKQKGDLLKHLSRKKQCKSLLKEIDNEEILRLNNIEEYNKNRYKVTLKSSKSNHKLLKSNPNSNQKNYKCRYCDNIYQYKQGRWRHEKTCKEKVNKDELIKLKEQNKELLELLKELKINSNIKGNTNIKGNNNSINNSHNTNNIQINNFDCEKIDYFTEKLAFQIVKRYPQMIGRFVEHLHFNENHPENHTVKIKDAKSGIGHILVNGKEKSYIMEDFLEEVSHNLKDKLYELNQIIPDERQDEFELLYDDTMDLLEKLKTDKKVKKRIKVACIDGTNKIHREKVIDKGNKEDL